MIAAKIVLYPFIEEAFSADTENAVKEIKKVSENGTVSPVIVVNRHGKITDLLKQHRLSYYELKIAHLISPQDFYLKAMYRLFFSSLPLFLFIRSQKIDVIHFHDILSAMSWGGTAKMYRIPYIISISQAERYAKYASLMILDANRLSCPSEMILERIPVKYRKKMDVVPTLIQLPFLSEKQIEKQRKEWLKRNKISDKAFLAAAEINQNLDELIALAEKVSEKTDTPVFVGVCHSEHEKIIIGKVTICPMKSTEFTEFLPLCRSFWGLDGLRTNSPDSYKAMMYGIPVAALDEGVYPEFVQNGKTGVLIASSDPNTRADAVLHVSENQEIASQGKNWVNKMTQNTVLFWQDLYYSLSSKTTYTASVGLLNNKEGE